MHSWETMMAPTNHGHNWYNNMQIKSEPIDPTIGYQPHSQVNMNLNTSTSPQTSPQSIDSMDSSNGQKQLYYNQTMQAINYNRPLGFNPLTPPGYTGLVAPQHPTMLPQRQTTPTRSFPTNDTSFTAPASLTPTHTPPMDVTPPKSPKELHETPEKEMDIRSDCGDSFDDASVVSDLDDEVIKNPRVNSHGKMKTYKCKQCNYVAVTKLSFWDHTRSHIKPEKMLSCPKCPFVTEYKHHLEYHLRNHSRSKPFQCPNCNYSCVNKSMLNSHLKSHSSVFQYRCVDCNYATKYCHSLKLHLRKYSHKPDIVLNLDGSPNPLPIIDVYGTRRGPKTKTQIKQEDAAVRQGNKDLQHRRHMKEQQLRLHRERELKQLQQHQHQEKIQSIHPQLPQQNQQQNNMLPSMLPNPLANMFQNAGSNMPLFSYFNLNFQMLAAQQQAAAMAQQLSPNVQHQNGEQSLKLPHEDIDGNDLTKSSSHDRSVMNLSHSIRSDSNDYYMPEEEEEGEEEQEEVAIKNYSDDDELASEASNDAHATISTNGSKRRRKGRAFKIEQSAPTDETNPRKLSVTDEDTPKDDSDVDKCRNSPKLLPVTVNTINNNNLTVCRKEKQSQTINNNNNNSVRLFECKFCDISFKDDVLYTIHMGYHGYNDVFKCNMCGEKCDDRVAFFLHIARSSHQ